MRTRSSFQGNSLVGVNPSPTLGTTPGQTAFRLTKNSMRKARNRGEKCPPVMRCSEGATTHRRTNGAYLCPPEHLATQEKHHEIQCSEAHAPYVQRCVAWFRRTLQRAPPIVSHENYRHAEKQGRLGLVFPEISGFSGRFVES